MDGRIIVCPECKEEEEEGKSIKKNYDISKKELDNQINNTLLNEKL